MRLAITESLQIDVRNQDETKKDSDKPGKQPRSVLAQLRIFQSSSILSSPANDSPLQEQFTKHCSRDWRRRIWPPSFHNPIMWFRGVSRGFFFPSGSRCCKSYPLVEQVASHSWCLGFVFASAVRVGSDSCSLGWVCLDYPGCICLYCLGSIFFCCFRVFRSCICFAYFPSSAKRRHISIEKNLSTKFTGKNDSTTPKPELFETWPWKMTISSHYSSPPINICADISHRENHSDITRFEILEFLTPIASRSSTIRLKLFLSMRKSLELRRRISFFYISSLIYSWIFHVMPLALFETHHSFTNKSDITTSQFPVRA